MKKTENYIKARGLSDITKKTYLTHIKEYLKFLKKPLKKTTEQDALNFLVLKEKKMGHKMSTNHANTIKASIRALYYAHSMDSIAGKLKGRRPERKIPNTLTKDSMKKVIEASKSFYKEEWKNQRGYFFITLLYQSGARIGEITTLKRADFNFENNTVKLGSKRSEYLRKLNPLWVKEFKEWLKLTKRKKYVFGNTDEIPYAVRTAEWYIENLCARTLNKAYVPHNFRATCITHRLESGEDLSSVSPNFHQSPNTTMIYVGGTARSLKKMNNPFEDLECDK